ncbi:MAG: hypothetical protein P0Y65_11135 [Candidatus Devosia phytovorans]|uniref:Uncharacterized protein n=1 Tax=Candidatus Devosia phytovorans TaxID=3121372 RepID=A0AAJ5VSA6_9HYPH|nr:hypothetical protein [Devosia sp.]WEK02762.1 MAG: hypothetical protein P0Y65_11135 [Devosia sp.]
MIDPVIVQDPAQFAFAGSIFRSHAEAAWVWVYRDLCPELINPDSLADGSFEAAALEAILPQILQAMKAGIDTASADPEKDRRLRATLGSKEARDALPNVVMALRSRALLVKAQAFGKAINGMADDAAIGAALQSMPLKDQALSALLFHAALPQITNPTRLTTSIIKLSGNATEAAVLRLGFAPVIDAILAHAQNKVFALQPVGPFADIDLICRSLERFHRLVRSLTGYIEFARGSRWAQIISAITKQVSDRVEPRLRDVVSDINLALRRGREGHDRVDNDALLSAINGVYLLATIRECRDSLALNALFDQAWSQSGEALEMHLQRNLDLMRQNPGDANTGARLDAGIKMAEIRFNPEYAETLRRARASAERRS